MHCSIYNDQTADVYFDDVRLGGIVCPDYVVRNSE
jgi:hypothetical protein